MISTKFGLGTSFRPGLGASFDVRKRRPPCDIQCHACHAVGKNTDKCTNEQACTQLQTEFNSLKGSILDKTNPSDDFLTQISNITLPVRMQLQTETGLRRQDASPQMIRAGDFLQNTKEDIATSQTLLEQFENHPITTHSSLENEFIKSEKAFLQGKDRVVKNFEEQMRNDFQRRTRQLRS